MATPIRISEKAFMQQVIDLARLYQWQVYHTWLSIRSAAGFPDLVLARPPRLLFAECKTERGIVTLAQAEWLTALRGCPGVEAYLWRPADLEQIARILAWDYDPDDNGERGTR